MWSNVVSFLVLVSTVLSNDITYPRNCKEVQNQGITSSGVYTIQPKFSPKPFLVYCNMNLKGGGWIYFLNREDGSQNFSRPWNDYKTGFGNLAGEFWLGLDHLYELTVDEINELLIELIDWDLRKSYVHYKMFSVAGEEESFRLQLLGGFSGDINDAFTVQAGHKFSTIDRDNDEHQPESCANFFGGGGWWFKSCFQSHLTGNYLQRKESLEGSNQKGICWLGYDDYNQFYSFKEARMMIRPQSDHSIN